jgi:primosomal replication protein N
VLRYTPAGIPALNFKISHTSEQIEAGNRREVQCEVASLALDQAALLASRLNVGDAVLVEGFLARKSRNSTQLVLHVNKVQMNSQ